MPCATPPSIWPSSTIGLITRPQSWTTTYLSTSSRKVFGSTRTYAAWHPDAHVDPVGLKCPVASSPGCSPSSSGGPARGLVVNCVAASVPPPNAYRMGLASTATAASGTPRSGEPLTRTLPSTSSRSAGIGSGTFAAARCAFSDTTLRDGDLSPDSGVGLALARNTGGSNHLAGHQDLNVCAFIRTDPSSFHVGAEPHSHMIARRSRPKHLESALEQGRVVAAVVDDAVAVLPGDPDFVRKGVWLEKVSPAHLDAVETKLGGDRIQGALHHEAGVRPAGAAIRRCRRGVGVCVAKPDSVVGHAVRPRDLGGGDDRQDDAVRRIRAAVGDGVRS